MNRNDDNNRQRKNHYADFDEHGNAQTGNKNSLSRYNPDSRYGDFGQQNQRRDHGQQYRLGGRATNASRAYGDMSQGTRYGEGGSNEGGGTAYGHSYYGLSGNRGPGMTQYNTNRSQSRQYDGYGDYDSFMNRNYGNEFGHTRDGGYTNNDRNTGNRDSRNYSRNDYESGYAGRENTGYDRGYDSFRNTGYGATGYNNRDVDRERSTHRNQDYRNENRGYRDDSDRSYNDRNRFNHQNDW
ncbi:hypothetical protein [uncultured Pontibacter sp.]|uniref:hypothetical protein n=1 Tax=uncultured Pontibacter sp. TaxID=453356 RepID=UPI0026020CD3|nr:hypothetical protein [uncultured Pontibacter sp.]